MITKTDCYNANIIREDGFFSPFVALIAGAAYVGDCDNLNQFPTVEAAVEHCRGAILSGIDLTRAKHAYDYDRRNNAAAEYLWHCDAQLQLAALGAR